MVRSVGCAVISTFIEVLGSILMCISLVSDKTVALLLAHIYGKWFDTRPFVETARKHNIKVICETWCLLILTCYRMRLTGQWVYNKLG